MKQQDKIILNAMIVAAIVFLSTLNTSYPPSIENFYSALIGAFLALLTQLKTLTDTKEPITMGLLL